MGGKWSALNTHLRPIWVCILRVLPWEWLFFGGGAMRTSAGPLCLLLLPSDGRSSGRKWHWKVIQEEHSWGGFTCSSFGALLVRGHMWSVYHWHFYDSCLNTSLVVTMTQYAIVKSVRAIWIDGIFTSFKTCACFTHTHILSALSESILCPKVKLDTPQLAIS